MTDGTAKGQRNGNSKFWKQENKIYALFLLHNLLGPNNVLSFILFCFEINKIREEEREGSRLYLIT